MGTEIFCFANGDVKVLLRIPILLEIILVCLPGGGKWCLVFNKNPPCSSTKYPGITWAAPGGWDVTTHCCVPHWVESDPREWTLPLTMLEVCLRDSGRCSAWPQGGLSDRKGAECRVGHLSRREGARVPMTVANAVAATHPPAPRFHHVHLQSTGSKRWVGTQLSLLVLTRSHSCNLTHSLSRKISFQGALRFLQRKGCSCSALQSWQGRACVSTWARAVQQDGEMWCAGS